MVNMCRCCLVWVCWTDGLLGQRRKRSARWGAGAGRELRRAVGWGGSHFEGVDVGGVVAGGDYGDVFGWSMIDCEL